MITDENIKEYSDLIDDELGLDELLLMLAELINDPHISEVVDKYVDDYNGMLEEARNWKIKVDKIKEVLQVSNM